jgi:hypothetical protein
MVAGRSREGIPCSFIPEAIRWASVHLIPPDGAVLMGPGSAIFLLYHQVLMPKPLHAYLERAGIQDVQVRPSYGEHKEQI